MRYKDITDKYNNPKKYKIKKQEYYIDDDGNQYNVDNKYVILNPTIREIEVAKILGKTLGGDSQYNSKDK